MSNTCSICGKDAPLRAGAPILCNECMKQQRPIAEAWREELRQLIKKHKDKGLYKTWFWCSFYFLQARIFDALEEPSETYLHTGEFSDWLNQERDEKNEGGN